MLLLILCLNIAAALAQQNKPVTAVFSKFSHSIDLSESLLHNTVLIIKGQPAVVKFGKDFSFSGTVISNEQVLDNLQTIIIKSAEYNDALLQISKQTNEDKSISYVGRIFSNNSTDGYEIRRSDNGQYRLQKFETARILQDCKLLKIKPGNLYNPNPNIRICYSR